MIFKKAKFVEVLLPLALPKTYTYAVPGELSDKIRFGIRVEVSLKNKFYAGLVIDLHDEIAGNDYKIKPVISIIDSHPIISEVHFELWKWIAQYYMCTIGEVMTAALPAGLKMSSETIIELLPESDSSEIEFNDDEYMVYEALELKSELNLKDIKEILGKSSVYSVIQSLLSKGIINVREELINTFKPKQIKLIRISPEYNDEDKIAELFIKLKRSNSKTRVLLSYFQMTNTGDEVLKSELTKLAAVKSSVIKELRQSGILIETVKTASRLKPGGEKREELPDLSEYQKITVDRIEECFESNNQVLLHGVTGSGKTRIYQEFIQKAISSGGQVLYLVPEIGLTAQMINRLTGVFGEDVSIFHSKINQNERVEVWNSAFHGKPVILAARSGIFLPFRDLRLIIVDEEHDSSYKQQNPSPHYNARDIASYLANKLNIRVLLGTATPSLESYHNCMIKKYCYVKIDQRFGQVSMPEIRINDMRNTSALVPNNLKYSIALISMIQQTLNNHEQVLLFQNRRGFAPVVICHTCGWNAKCPNCDVSLTFHKKMEEIRCHYCGFRKKIIEICPVCGSLRVGNLGYGTEKIESELKQFFPDANIKRMDLDTIRTRNDIENLMIEFEEKKIDILVGTQMITKGLDFDRIGLVGIIDIDKLMQFPDFRSNERTFQLAVQVAGRSGRRNKQGLVIIQTHDPENPLINDIINSDFKSFSSRELEEREFYRYPPFIRLIELTILHSNFDKCRAGADLLAKLIKIHHSDLIGPAVPGIGRIRGLYQISVIVRIDMTNHSLNKVKTIIKKSIEKVFVSDGLKSLKVRIDVDPY
ncbi:MAG: primosomal protein N' [Deltaproteobacteria bacterium]